MAKVVVRKECFSFSSLLLSLFLFYGDSQWQDCLEVFPLCLDYVCRRQKGRRVQERGLGRVCFLPPDAT